MLVKIIGRDNSGNLINKNCLCYDDCIICNNLRKKKTSHCYISGKKIKCDSVVCGCGIISHQDIFEEFKIIEMINGLDIDTGIIFE